MKIAIDYPALTVGIPQGSRLTKAIWGSECLEVEVPELSHVELQAAISWFQADGRGEQETIYRIGERHFRKAIPSV